MRLSRLFQAIIISILLLGTVGAFALASPQSQTTTSFSDGGIIEYTIPVSGAAPLHISLESDGKVWFTMPEQNQIGRLVITTTTDFAFDLFTVPTANSYPYDLVYANGIVWFTQRDGNQIGRLDATTGVITEFAVPTANSQPKGIDAANDGMIWFAQSAVDKIARLDPTTNAFTEFTYPFSTNVGFEDLEAASKVSVTAVNIKSAVQFNTSTENFGLLPITAPFEPLQAPHGVALDRRGEPWVAVIDSARLARSNPGTLATWRFYELLDGESKTPQHLTIQHSNSLDHVWYTDSSGYVGYLIVDDTTPAFLAERPLPSPGSQPHDIAVDANGRVFITENGTGKIAEWRAPYFNRLLAPFINSE